MRKVLLVSLQLILSASVLSQAPFPTIEEGRLLLESKTCVVLENSPFSEFNPSIREAVTDFWTLTPYEFINIDEFNKRREDPSWSFLVLTESAYERDNSGSSFAFLNLLLGKKVRNLEDMPEFGAIPLDFAGEDADAEYGYKLGLLVEFIQQHAKVIINNPTTPGVRFLKYYNKFVPEIEGKTILAREIDMVPSVASEDEIKSFYSGSFRLVTGDEIRDAIAERRPNTLILHKVGPPEETRGAYVFKMLIGTDDASMYYFNNHKIDQRNPNGFLPADLRRIGRF
ncbi:MAG: hypothetical protein R6W67_05300 [Bacteroidales bacterium]